VVLLSQYVASRGNRVIGMSQTIELSDESAALLKQQRRPMV
jgi:hypothetical protein